MNKLFATALIAAAFVFAAGSTIAQDSTKAPTITKEDQDKAKAEKAAKKQAKSELTPEEKKAANAAKQNQSKEAAKDTTNKP